MKDNIAVLKQKAEEARMLYRAGAISRDEAVKLIKPYQQAFNEVSVEKAKQYHLRPQRFSVNAYLR